MTRDFTKLARYPVLVRVMIFILVLLVLWVPFAAPVYLLGHDQNSISILTMLVLYGEFILLVRAWGRNVYQTPHLLQHYGLELTQQNAWDLLRGFVFGALSLLTLFMLEGGLGWVIWRTVPPTSLISVTLEGLAVALGVGFAEELLFRGWLLDELQRDYTPTAALWLDSLLFGLLHFIKPLPEIIRTFPQLPGLIILGLALVWAKRSRHNRLGMSIGLHGGLVGGYYVLNVGHLIDYSHQVPEWVTGIDRNPLAGGIGLIFLSAIALTMHYANHKHQTRSSTP